MSRDPGIHITQSKLSRVLRDIEVITMLDDEEIQTLAEEILERSKNHSTTHRSLTVDKAKLLKSTSRVVMSMRDDASTFAHYLILIRRKNKHQGISIIKPGSSQWLVIKEVTNLALEFMNDFDLKKEEGFKAYITLGIEKMYGKFNLNQFSRLHQTICDEYQAIKEIKEDLTPQQTMKGKLQYEKLLGEKGIIRDYSRDAGKLVYFIRAKQEAKRYNVEITDYIKAQFKGLEWANAYPDPSQLVGPKAIDRMNRYLSENQIKPGKQVDNKKVSGIIKQLRQKWDECPDPD